MRYLAEFVYMYASVALSMSNAMKLSSCLLQTSLNGLLKRNLTDTGSCDRGVESSCGW